jgi:ferrous iron transport protein A
MATLDGIPAGKTVRIDRLDGPPAFVQKLMEFGLFEGDEVHVVAVAPLGDPIEIEFSGTRIGLRLREAANIAVTLRN